MIRKNELYFLWDADLRIRGKGEKGAENGLAVHRIRAAVLKAHTLGVELHADDKIGRAHV